MSWLLYELSCPCNARSSIAMPTVFNLTVTIDTVIIFTLLLLLLFYYYHHYKTVATDKLLWASLYLGAAELTTHLSRLINILWLPMCQINKCGFYFPRRLLRSPILVGHQPLVVIPLSGTVPGRASGPSRSRIDNGGGLQYVFWKRVRAFRVFSSRRIYRRKGDVRGWTRGPHHSLAWPGVARAMAWCGCPLAPLRLCFGPRLVSGEIGTSAFVSSNSENISCVTFWNTKIAENRELALWHLVNRLVPENA
jgi:hypothetical protein